MTDFRQLARDPKFRSLFERLLRLAAGKGDADQVAERLAWGIDPNCSSARGRTPMIVNVRGSCPRVRIVELLLNNGADPSLTDNSGLSALDYARRKLLRLQAKRPAPPRKSPSLDENDQLRLSADEQAELEHLRAASGGDPALVRIWWQERLRSARLVFNDPDQIERIVSLLESA